VSSARRPLLKPTKNELTNLFVGGISTTWSARGKEGNLLPRKRGKTSPEKKGIPLSAFTIRVVRPYREKPAPEKGLREGDAEGADRVHFYSHRGKRREGGPPREEETSDPRKEKASATGGEGGRLVIILRGADSGTLFESEHEGAAPASEGKKKKGAIRGRILYLFGARKATRF